MLLQGKGFFFWLIFNYIFFFFIREYPGNPTFVIITNLASATYTLDLSITFIFLPESLTVVSSAASSNYAM